MDESVKFPFLSSLPHFNENKIHRKSVKNAIECKFLPVQYASDRLVCFMNLQINPLLYYKNGIPKLYFRDFES